MIEGTKILNGIEQDKIKAMEMAMEYCRDRKRAIRKSYGFTPKADDLIEIEGRVRDIRIFSIFDAQNN